jgi:hypothetical protein
VKKCGKDSLGTTNQGRPNSTSADCPPFLTARYAHAAVAVRHNFPPRQSLIETHPLPSLRSEPSEALIA